MLSWYHDACTIFFFQGREVKHADESVLPVTKKEGKGKGNEPLALGWKMDAQTYIFLSFISSALFATSQLVHWDYLLKSSARHTQPLQEELGGFHRICLSLELQDQTSVCDRERQRVSLKRLFKKGKKMSPDSPMKIVLQLFFLPGHVYRHVREDPVFGAQCCQIDLRRSSRNCGTVWPKFSDNFEHSGTTSGLLSTAPFLCSLVFHSFEISHHPGDDPLPEPVEKDGQVNASATVCLGRVCLLCLTLK